VWRRRRWSFTAAFVGGDGDIVTGSDAYMLLWLEEGEWVRRGWSVENEGLGGVPNGEGERRRGSGKIRRNGRGASVTETTPRWSPEEGGAHGAVDVARERREEKRALVPFVPK
jgi:hypothetical protein